MKHIEITMAHAFENDDPSDLQAIAKDCLRAGLYEPGWQLAHMLDRFAQNRMRYGRQFRSVLSHNKATCLLAKYQGQPLGCLIGVPGYESSKYTVAQIYVNPQYRRMAVGTTLIETAKRHHPEFHTADFSFGGVGSKEFWGSHYQLKSRDSNYHGEESKEDLKDQTRNAYLDDNSIEVEIEAAKYGFIKQEQRFTSKIDEIERDVYLAPHCQAPLARHRLGWMSIMANHYYDILHRPTDMLFLFDTFEDYIAVHGRPTAALNIKRFTEVSGKLKLGVYESIENKIITI